MPRDYSEYEYDDELPETYRNPLKPFLIALVVLLLLFAAIIVLLYMRLQTANTRAETLSQELTAVQMQLDDLRAQQAAPTDAPTPEPVETPTPTPTPEPTPEPTATPEPTPEPTPTPKPLLRDTVTDEMLGYVYRPADEFWYDEAKTAAVIPFMLAVHYGPGMDWGENMALNMNDTVELLAKQNGWLLLRTADGRYGWAASELLRETADAAAATATPAAAADTAASAEPAAPVAPATAAPTPTPTPDYTEVSNPDLQ